MSLEHPKKFIEIREVIRKKSPKLAKWIPSPILSYLERLIHQEDINVIMTKFADQEGLEFVNSLIQHLEVEVSLEGAENIPLDQPVIFASNHPLGGLDGIAFMYAIGKYRSDVKFLVNDILMNIGNLKPLFVPVNKIGGQGKAGIQAIEQAYASDNALLVFPAGLVSRKNHGVVKDLEWKKSFINKAKRYQKDIVPVYIEGNNSNFFYNFAQIRQKIGIKANLEMIFLPDELFSQKNKKIKIRIGEKIPYTYFDQSKNELAWADEVKQIVYGMSQEK